MRQIIKDFVQICALTLLISEPIYEFGALQVPGQEGFADLRPFFPGKEYIGSDMQEGSGVDIVLDLHKINLPSETAGTVLLMDTLEHVEYLRKAMDEVQRILKKEGMVLMSSVMLFPIHNYPYDYWRFTPEAFRSLLKPFESSFVDFAGPQESFPHTIVGVGFKSAVEDELIKEFRERINNWKTYWSRPETVHR